MSITKKIKKLFSKSSDKGVGVVSTGVPYSHFQYTWTKGQGISPIGKKSFKQYKIFYATDPIVQTNINIVSRYIFTNGYDIVGDASPENIKKIKKFF